MTISLFLYWEFGDMHISGYSNCDLTNGEGARVSLFVSGCTLRCHNCFNKDAWDFDYGELWNEQYKQRVLNDLSSDYIDGLSILGGDPLEPLNIPDVCDLITTVKQKLPNKSIWLWTGRKREAIKDWPMIKSCDVVVSEPYIEKFNNHKTKYRGSTNQLIWNGHTGEIIDRLMTEDEHHDNSWQGTELTKPISCDC